MTQLTSKKRDNLPSEVFGLPKERQFPLNDEVHVRKAIQFFGHAPVTKRHELANNINRRAQDLKMNVKTSSDSPFAQYAKKGVIAVQEASVLLESAEDTDYATGIDFSRQFYDNARKLWDQYKVQFKTAALNIVSGQLTLTAMQKFEEQNFEISSAIVEKKVFTKDAETPWSVLRDMNYIFCSVYEQIFQFMQYDLGVADEKKREWYTMFQLNALIDGIFAKLSYTIRNSQFKPFNDTVRLITKLLDVKAINPYQVYRLAAEMSAQISYQCSEEKHIDGEEPDIHNRMIERMKELFVAITQTIQNTSYSMHYNDEVIAQLLSKYQLDSFSGKRLIDVLMDTKKEMDFQLNIIKGSMIEQVGKEMSHTIESEQYQFILEGVVDEDHIPLMIAQITYLDRAIYEANANRYGMTMQLEQNDLLFHSRTKKYAILIPIYDMDSNVVYLAVSGNNKLYLLGKSTKDGAYTMMCLYDPAALITPSLFNLICPRGDFEETQSYTIVRLIPTNHERSFQPETMQKLTEGFHIDAQGNMKFTIVPKKTYMDEYAEAHRILVANHKSKNYEGMKPNLAFMFALINQIERDIMFSSDKDKYSQTELDDATKARSFAINDFKTYMKELHKHEPQFNFTQYYAESDYGKVVVHVTPDNILGVKRLFQTIMMS